MPAGRRLWFGMVFIIHLTGEKLKSMKNLMTKGLAILMICAGVSFTACKNNKYAATNSKRVKHQQALKNKYDEPTEKLANGSKMKGDLGRK